MRLTFAMAAMILATASGQEPPRPLFIRPWDEPLPAAWADWRQRYEAGDLDFDGYLTSTDLALLVWCESGPGVPPRNRSYDATTQPAAPMRCDCELADLDGDGDVDQRDFGILQRRAGRYVPATRPLSSRPTTGPGG